MQTKISPVCKQPEISVLIPAFNAEATVTLALDSLVGQTFGGWEALVVDDGSTDATAELVEGRAAGEPRIRLLRQANAGVSAARNTAMAAAAGRWVAFLDADDWLDPTAFETRLQALAARPELDAVHSGWTRIAADGRRLDEICPRTEEDMFSWHAHNCAFAIHSVLVRRELVERAGGFDPALTASEDWDLWVRLSRLGARWGRVQAHQAFYRMRAASASLAAGQLLRDGLAVIDRAHGPDERLAGQEQAHPQGEDGALRARSRLIHAVYSAGLALGQGEDARPLLEPVAGDRCPELDADQVAYALFEGVPLGAGTIPSDWPSFSTELFENLSSFLDELERITAARQLARRAKRRLERIAAEAGAARPLFGKIEFASLDLERPIGDIAVGPDSERLLLDAVYAGMPLPRLELPASDGRVPAELIADAVADENAWTLLRAFFDATLAKELDVDTSGGRLVVGRRGHLVVDIPLPADEPAERLVHDHAGWELLLQELCGDPSTPNEAFYDRSYDGELEPCGRLDPKNGWVDVELAAPLPELSTRRPVRVAATLGGATLAALEVKPSRGRVRAGALRRAICTQAGFEVCRLAVREGVLGRPRDDGVSLRERLTEAVERLTPPALPRWSAPDGFSLSPDWRLHAARALNGDSSVRLIARRRDARTGLSGSRSALIPQAASGPAVAAARAAGEPVIELGEPGGEAPALYVPGIVWHAASGAPGAVEQGSEPAVPGPGRLFFESLFAAGADPWRYTSGYEQGKYEQTLSLLGELPPARALELACAEGHFTAQLAPLVGRLTACDVSEIALERARHRCADHGNVEFRYHDLFAERIEGRYDLIVCSEVLYYAGDRARLGHAVKQVARALRPGGLLLTAHANLVADDPNAPGFDWELPFGARTIGEAFSSAGLRLTEELVNPIYRVQAYRRPRRRTLARLHRPGPVRAAAPLPDDLPREVQERFLWEGGEPAGAPPAQAETWDLPILMFHRVAPSGSEGLREWRVTPDQFEAQLHYLRSAGYASVSLDAWQAAAERHQPLSGRRVMLTFDDGYEDFAEFAHPLLRQYGFDATVFLVSERIGRANDWDSGYGETLPLMDWETLRSLDGQGVTFGAHSATHPMLTALSLEEVVREASDCRTQLVEGLGHLVRAFAYPYGDFDAAIARVIGGCGFEFGLTTEGYMASASVPMLTLPRTNVAGTASFDAFVRMLAPPGAG